MAQGSITSVEELIEEGYIWAVDTAKEVNSKHLGWWFVTNYPLVAVNQRIQVRNIKGLAPVTEVSEYAQNMRLGDQFPPVIVTKDGWLVDGHTRTEAARKINWDTFPALVLNVNFGDLAPDSVMRKTLLKLGAAQNKKHGRRMTTAEIVGLIKQVSEGETPKQIQRDMHVPYSTANAVWNAARAERKAQNELNIPLTGELSISHLKLFGGKIEKYTNPVWGKLFSLTQDAHLGVTEVNDLMSRVESIGDETERVRFLEAEERHHGPAISSGTHITPSKARRVKQGLGFAMKEENPADTLVERDPVRGPEYLRYLMDFRNKLDKIIFEQEQIERSRNAN